MMKRVSAIFPLVLLLLICAVILSGCRSAAPTVPTTDPTTTPTENTASTADITCPTDSSLSQNTWTKVDAALVNDQGEVVETMELSINVMTWEQEGRGFYNLRFFYPENIHNSGGGVLPYPEGETSYTCSSGSGVEKAWKGNTLGRTMWAMMWKTHASSLILTMVRMSI